MQPNYRKMPQSAKIDAFQTYQIIGGKAKVWPRLSRPAEVLERHMSWFEARLSYHGLIDRAVQIRRIRVPTLMNDNGGRSAAPTFVIKYKTNSIAMVRLLCESVSSCSNVPAEEGYYNHTLTRLTSSNEEDSIFFATVIRLSSHVFCHA